MNVNIEKKVEQELLIQLGDLFVDKDHNGLYLASRIGDGFALSGFKGNYWGTWETIEEFKEDVTEIIREGRFIQYSQNDYELELKRK